MLDPYKRSDHDFVEIAPYAIEQSRFRERVLAEATDYLDRTHNQFETRLECMKVLELARISNFLEVIAKNCE